MNAFTPERTTDSWSAWRQFPDPRVGGMIVAPIGAGVFELRRAATGERVLFGAGEHVAARLTNLLPATIGQSLRNNMSRRQYILRHLDDLEYRTMSCTSRREADILLAQFDVRLYRFRV
jgi:hypothetical protein